MEQFNDNDNRPKFTERDFWFCAGMLAIAVIGFVIYYSVGLPK